MALQKGLPYASEEERRRRQAMTGWPIPGASVRVVDAEMRDVPRDGRTIGEVVVMGDQVMDGYFREPEGTGAADVREVHPCGCTPATWRSGMRRLTSIL